MAHRQATALAAQELSSKTGEGQIALPTTAFFPMVVGAVMNRRRFIKSSLSLAALGAAPLGCQDGAPAVHTANRWGAIPAGFEAALLPEDKRPERVLEMFCLGGVSPWESFYTVPEYGKPNKMYWAFHEHTGGLGAKEWYSECGPGAPAYEPFATDSLGTMVNLGPFIHPLRARPDILARMRVWVMVHDIEPHEVAIPLAITGMRLGNPRQAALGSHVMRHWQDRGPADRTAPYTYALYQSTYNLTNNATGASTTGLHPATARPMQVQLGPGTRLARQLPRPATTGYKNSLDSLVNWYSDRFADRLKVAEQLVRSPGFSDFRFSRRSMAQHQVLTALLPPEVLKPATTDLCIFKEPEPLPNPLLDEVTTSIDLARHLLTADQYAAKYVQVLEGGIVTDPNGQGYDAHGAHVAQQGPNLAHALNALMATINRPGESDPKKLNLDKDFVLLNTEFGRAPQPEFTPRNPHGYGSDHWPWGYVVAGFGSFCDQDRRGVVGAIGDDALARQGTTPAEHRAAMLLSMGIWPFTEESFAVGDVRGATSELDAAMILRDRVLGYSA